MDGWFQKDKPLWLPEGSVRSLLALCPTTVFLGIVLGRALGYIDQDAFSATTTALGPYAGGAFIYYFKQREAAREGSGKSP